MPDTPDFFPAAQQSTPDFIPAPPPKRPSVKVVNQQSSMRAARPSEVGRGKVPDPGSRVLNYDPNDPLGYAKQIAEREAASPNYFKSVKGAARGAIVSMVDPRMLPLEYAAGSAGALAAEAPIAIKGLVGLAQKAAAGYFGATAAKSAKDEAQQGHWGAASFMGLAGVLGLHEAIRGGGVEPLVKQLKDTAQAEQVATTKKGVNSNAAVQSQQVVSPTEADVHPGEAGQVSPRRGAGKSGSKPVTQPADARPSTKKAKAQAKSEGVVEAAPAGAKGPDPLKSEAAKTKYRNPDIVQKEIDDLEDKYEAKGHNVSGFVDPADKYSAKTLIGQTVRGVTYTEMPSDLAALYRERDTGISDQNNQSLKGAYSKLSPEATKGPMRKEDVQSAIKNLQEKHNLTQALHPDSQPRDTVKLAHDVYQELVQKKRADGTYWPQEFWVTEHAAEIAKDWNRYKNDFPESPQPLFDQVNAIVSDLLKPEEPKPASIAAKAGAKGPTPDEPATTGIAQRVNVAKAKQGRLGEVKPGKGTTPEAQVEKGRAEVAGGVDPVAHMDMMKARGLHADSKDIDILRAHEETLAKAANKAEDAYRANPKNQALKKAFDDAVDADTAWIKDLKPFLTEWSKSGMAMQGETDIDTGTWSGIRRGFASIHDEKMTPKQEVQAQGHVERVKNLEDRLTEAEKRLQDHIDSTAKTVVTKTTKPGSTRLPSDPKLLREHFEKRRSTLYSAPKGGRESGAVPLRGTPNFTQEEIRAVWQHAKDTYLDPAAARSEHANYDDMVNGVSRDLGLEPDEVRHIFSANKTGRTITNEMYRRMSERNAAVKQARQWVTTGGRYSTIHQILNFPRGLRVFGHGTVGMITHAGPAGAAPSSWSEYWPATIKQWKFFYGDTAIHQAAMEDMVRDPEYVDWLRAGLKIDPRSVYDNYQAYGKYIGPIGRKGNMGMDALKVFRLGYAKKVWAGLSDIERADPIMRQELAKSINHISGAGHMGLGKAEEFMFAPSLVAARWARYADVLRAGKTAATWKSATPAERAIAKFTGKRVMEIGAVYTSSLVANNALLKATGQKDRVNFTDPSRADWMRFKWGGKTIDPTGGSLAPLKLTAHIIQTATGLEDRRIDKGRPITKAQSIQESLYSYVRGSVEPLTSAGLDVAAQADFTGRPLPFSTDKGTPSRPKYGWGEYALSQGPIPFSGAITTFYDELRKKGVDPYHAKAIISTLQTLAVEQTGTRVAPASKTPMKPTHTLPRLKAEVKSIGRRFSILTGAGSGP